VAGAEGARAELARRRRADAVRPAWDDVVRIERAAAIARGAAADAVQAAARAERERVAVGARRAALAALHGPLRAARVAVGLVERAGARGATDDAERRGRAAGAAAAWLGARPALAREVAGWPQLAARIATHAQLAAACGELDRALGEHAQRRAALEAERAEVERAREASAARLADAQRAAAAFEARRTVSLDAAGRQEDAARLRCEDAERLVAIAGEARAAGEARVAVGARLAALATAAAEGAAQRADAERRREREHVVRDERVRVVAELRRAAGLDHARAELVDGEPCPLCGAAEHPWAGRDGFDALVAEAEARLGETAHALDGLARELAALDARDAARAVDVDAAGAARAAADAAEDAAGAAWRAQLAAMGELPLVDAPGGDAARAFADERLEAARAGLSAAREARREAQAIADATREAQAAVQGRRAEVDACETRARGVDAAIAAAEAAGQRMRGEREAKQAQAEEVAREIDVGIGAWARAVGAQRAERAEGAERAETEEGEEGAEGRKGAEGAERAAGAEGGGVWSVGVKAERAVREAIGERGSRAAIERLVAVWRACADEVAEAEAGVAAAVEALDAIGRERERTATELAARRDEAERRRAQASDELEGARGRLEQERGARGLEAGELRELLGGDPGRTEALAEQIAVLDRALERARIFAAERRRLVDDHAAARPEAEPGDVAALAAAAEGAERHAATLAAALAADEDARVRRATALDAFAEAERAAEVDRVLGEVIGSHDGKLFRSFAQSLTLDGLLAVANAHLEELAPRYQLERVPGHDLELQVIDRDLAGEIRSVQSLSGGESFLVSLALALGLSSMSAHDVRVRTLLIDEGFGTLDPATLDGALAVLDALQATGRQVGVISHVPALIERVGAHVRVAPRGGGRSEVIVAA
jgi:exonuclease SbcC